MVLLCFYLVGFIRSKLFSKSTLEVNVKLYIKIFHAESAHLKMCASGVGFFSYVPTAFRGWFMLSFKVNVVF